MYYFFIRNLALTQETKLPEVLRKGHFSDIYQAILQIC